MIYANGKVTHRGLKILSSSHTDENETFQNMPKNLVPNLINQRKMRFPWTLLIYGVRINQFAATANWSYFLENNTKPTLTSTVNLTSAKKQRLLENLG